MLALLPLLLAVNASAQPLFQRAAFVPEHGPGFELPRLPPNLSQARRDGLRAHLQSLQVPSELISRVDVVLSNVDRRYKRPIPGSEWDVRLLAFRESVVPPAEASDEAWEKAVDAALARFVGALDDPHAQYLDIVRRERYFAQMSNSQPGIGVFLYRAGQGVGVRRIYPGSPAERAGLRAGDLLHEVDGELVSKMDYDAAINSLRGPETTTVKVVVRRGGVLLPAKTIERRNVIIPKALARALAAEGRPEIGYLYLPQFGREVDEFVIAKIDELVRGGAKGLIFDVRGNPGGDLNVARSIVSEFLKPGQYIDSRTRQGQVMDRGRTTSSLWPELPLVVLVDRFSASSSELLAAAFQEHRRATIVGTTTAGKDVFQAVVPTDTGGLFGDDGTALVITQGGWTGPNGHAGKVKPDVDVATSEERELEIGTALLEQLFGRGGFAPGDEAVAAALRVLPPAR